VYILEHTVKHDVGNIVRPGERAKGRGVADEQTWALLPGLEGDRNGGKLQTKKGTPILHRRDPERQNTKAFKRGSLKKCSA